MGLGSSLRAMGGPKEDGGVATLGAPPTENGPEYLELKDKALADELDLQQEGAGLQLCASPSRPHSRTRPGAWKPPVVRLKRKPQVALAQSKTLRAVYKYLKTIYIVVP